MNWRFWKKASLVDPYRWSIEERLEQTVTRAIQRDAAPTQAVWRERMVAQRVDAARDAMADGRLQAARPCAACGQFHFGMTHDEAIAGARNAFAQSPVAESLGLPAGVSALAYLDSHFGAGRK